MIKPEILAPAGSMESLVAAVRSGADAVYLGAKDFSARSSAQNFSLDELKEAIGCCHLHGVSAYLTLNTLLTDRELPDALKLAADAYNMGIDALIIQDLGLAAILRRELPKLPLHASTQMSVHSPLGAKLLWDLGFKRVVLSREMTLKEIEEVRRLCPIELEVFVHGALCMSVSGQCYFSAILGKRSGNRGKCAQPCRLPFKLKGGSDFALSLKDNSLIDHIQKLTDIGVCSLKIEGRMKRPEYVASAVKACKEARDLGFLNESTRQNLEKVFSRTGFTDGYLLGERTGEMFGYRRREDVENAESKLLREIANTYKNEYSHIPIDMEFTAEMGKAPTLTVTDGKNNIFITGNDPAQKAESLPLSGKRCRESLSKTGGTPYLAREIKINMGENISLPQKAINSLRREALEKLSQKRRECHRKCEKAPEYALPTPYKSTEKAQKRARFADTDIPSEFKAYDLIFVPLFSDEKELKRLLTEGFSIGVEIPRGLFSREEKLKTALKKVKELGIEHALVTNLGGIYPAKDEGFILHGDFGLNIFNTAAIDFLESLGFSDVVLSFELSLHQIAALGSKLPRGVIDYGYLPLMLSRNCPGKTSKDGCRACKGKRVLQDRMGESFIFDCDGNCTELLNCVPLFLGDKLETFDSLSFHIHRFSVENSVEKVENTSGFSSETLKNNKFTRGLYFRGVK